MTCEIPYPNLTGRNPAGYAGVQVRLSTGYAIYSGFTSRLNLRPKSLVKIRGKQVLTGTVATSDALESEFHGLVKQWKEETFCHSSLTKIFNHPAYVRIMAMGKDGLSLVLRELQNSNDNWFYALKFMAGKDGEGVAVGVKDFATAKAEWLEWGYKNNYI